MTPRYADWRYDHLAYTPDTDDACTDAAAACVSKVLHPSGAVATCRFKIPSGVVEAFASREDADIRAAVVVWRFDEHQRISELLEHFR